MTLAAAIVGVLGTLASLLLLWYQRRHNPTDKQRLDDISDEIRKLEKEIHDLRAAGNHAAADAKLRQLFERIKTQCLADG